MRTIDITTTQNVTIRYELAQTRDRVLAFFMDMLILYGMVFLLGTTLSAAVPQPEYVIYLLILPMVAFYTLVSEVAMDGQTLGKKVLGIKVVKHTGEAPEFSDYLIRWAFRLVDITLSLGSIALILISSTDKGQRLGDMVAGTALIRLRPSMQFSLNDILRISRSDQYEPQFPQVKQFTDEEMLLIKEVNERAGKHQNQAHREALDEAVDYVAERLGLTHFNGSKQQFLNTVVKDYVVLTR